MVATDPLDTSRARKVDFRDARPYILSRPDIIFLLLQVQALVEQRHGRHLLLDCFGFAVRCCYVLVGGAHLGTDDDGLAFNGAGPFLHKPFFGAVAADPGRDGQLFFVHATLLHDFHEGAGGGEVARLVWFVRVLVGVIKERGRWQLSVRSLHGPSDVLFVGVGGGS